MKFKTKLISAFAAAAMLASFGAAVYAEGDDVAAVNGTGYQTLQEAISATDSGEIDLTADTKEDITIVTGQNVTIDLNGHTITNSKSHTITNNGMLKVKDSNGNNSGTVDSVVNGKAAVYNESGATATLESGTYERSENGTGSYYTVENRGTMTIGTENSAPEIHSAADGSSNIRNYSESATATMTIVNANVSGGMNAVKNDENGNLTINGGTFKNEYKQGSVILNGAEALITNGEFIGSGANVIYTTIGDDSSGHITSKGNTEVTGGTFTANGNASVFKVDANATATVTGGTFSDTVNSGYIKDEYMTVKNENGTYTVKKLENADAYVARMNSIYYETINDAIDDAEEERKFGADIINLLKDTDEDVIIPENKKIHLYLNGHKITNDKEHTITNKGKLNVYGDETTGGTIDNVTHGKAAVYNAPGATAYLSGGTYTRSEEAGSSSGESGSNSFYVIQNQGTMTITESVLHGQAKIESNSKFSSLVANGWQDGTKNEGKTEAKLTIKGGTFSGGINTIKNDDWGILTIENGTFENMAQHALLNWNVTTISGGTFEVPSGYYTAANGYLDDTMDQGKLTITGGIFTTGVMVNSAGGSNAEKAAEGINISGGTFGADVSKYLADGCAMSTGKTYTVLDPKNDTGTVISGTYKSAVKNDKYEQLQIFENVTIPETGEVSFKVTTSDTSLDVADTMLNYKTAAVEGNVTIGLIITGIPADETVDASVNSVQ